MDYKVSVIIPMYNAEGFIEAVVDSLLAQTLKETEIIVVNDCSPDNSMAVCRRRYGDNDRVMLIDQPKNMGPGEARNTGIKAARGEYIAFADSDDNMLPNALEEMYKGAKQENADVLHCTGAIFPLVKDAPANLLDVDVKDHLALDLDRFEPADKITVISDDLMERYEKWKKHAYHWAVWNKLYRKEFLLSNDLKFGEMKLSEDIVFCFSCLFLAKRYVLMPGRFYLYRMAAESLCRGKHSITMMERALSSAINAVPILNRLMDKVPFFTEHPECRQGVIDFVINNLEEGYIRSIFEEIGAEEIFKDGTIKRIMEEKFGQYADYVYFTFIALHQNYPHIDDMLQKMSDIDYLLEEKAKYEKLMKEQKENGTE